MDNDILKQTPSCQVDMIGEYNTADVAGDSAKNEASNVEPGSNSMSNKNGRTKSAHNQVCLNPDTLHHYTTMKRKSINPFADMFRLNLESKVALRLYGHHRTLDDEQTRQEVMERFIIHPMSDFRFYWDMVLVIILFFQVLILPVNITFFSTSFSVTWLVINGISDTVFLVDVVLNFFTGIPDQEDVHLTILKKKEIRKRYLKGWFFIDLVSSLPTDYIFLTISTKAENTTIARASRGFKFLKLAKMLSLLKLFRLTRLLRYLRKFEDATNLTSSHLRMLKLVLLMLLLAHWSGCMQFLVPSLEDFPQHSWVVLDNLVHAPVWEKYTWSLFKAMSHMLGIGYGRVPPRTTSDVLVITLSMLTAGAFYATFIGGISSLSLSIDSAGRNYSEKIAQVNEYLKFRKIPKSLRHKVQDYYEHRFQRKCFDEEQILNEISPTLREEILMYQLGGLLRSVPFFKKAEVQFLQELVTLLQFEVYLQGENIIKGGTRGSKMFFIEHGIVEVLMLSGEVAATLEKGSHFGEICLMSKEARRIATVRAKTKCDLFSLSKENFDEMLQDYPYMRELIKKVAELRLQSSGFVDKAGNLDPDFWNGDNNLDIDPKLLTAASAFMKNPTTFSSMDSIERNAFISEMEDGTNPQNNSPTVDGNDFQKTNGYDNLDVDERQMDAPSTSMTKIIIPKIQRSVEQTSTLERQNDMNPQENDRKIAWEDFDNTSEDDDLESDQREIPTTLVFQKKPVLPGIKSSTNRESTQEPKDDTNSQDSGGMDAWEDFGGKLV